jgi:glutamate carboxypeptidase
VKHLLECCEGELPRMVEAIEALVRIESPTGDKHAVDACGCELQRLVVEAGGRLEIQARADAGDHVLARFGSGARPVLILGHHDTVWPLGELVRRPVRRDGGVLFGPGVFDMKAGLVLALTAIRALRMPDGTWPRGITLLSTSDEETGSATSRSLIEAEARRSQAVLVLEPSLPGGALKTSRKGCGEFHVRISGRPAHAGIEPEKGASAIHELARQILAIQALADPARGITINVGVVQGGTRGNVVAAEAGAVVDVRVSRMADAESVAEAMSRLTPSDPGTRIAVTGGIDRPPLERTPVVERLFELARQTAAGMGRTLGEGATGGGSDGNLTAAQNVPTIDGLGAVGCGAHALDEHVVIQDLAWRAALVAGLVRKIWQG